MIQEILDTLPDAVNRLHAPTVLAIAGVGLVLALIGARFSRAVIALSLVSAGTVIGLQMPRWFGWAIDPMGTAFGMAIVLGLSGYVLPALWEGVFLSAFLAGIAGTAVWLKLAPHASWHVPAIDWSATAVEIAGKIRLSLPTALTTALPVALGIGATIGALTMVIWQKMGKVILYSTLGASVFVVAGILGVRQIRPEWLSRIPDDSFVQEAIFAVLLILCAGIQFLIFPRSQRKARPAPTSENKLHLNQFVANGPALRVQAAEAGVLAAGLRKQAGGVRTQTIPAKIR
jgi:hypothetical protein